MTRHRTLFITDRPEIHRTFALDAAPGVFDIDMLVSPTKAAVIAALPGTEFLITERTGDIDADMIAGGGDLRLIQRLGSRIHDIDLPAAAAAGVPVCCWPLLQSAMVAEHAVALVLALAKRLRDSMQAMVDGNDWGEPQECDANTFAMNFTHRTGIGRLAGATVGIVAMGEIGTELAMRLRAFGCEVRYNNRRRLPTSAEERIGVQFRTLDDLLEECAIVCLLVPYSPQTTGMTDAAFLDRMQPGSLLISCGASTTLDEHAVADAYRSGHLGGIATDGHRWEPTQPDGPLVTLSRDPAANVVLTPHSAQGNLELSAEMRIPEYTNLLNVLSGDPLNHRVG